MTSPSVKATETLEKPPATKPLRSKWIPDDVPKPSVNVSYSKVRRQFIERHPNNNKTYPKFDYRRCNHYGLKLRTYMPPVKKSPFSFLRSAVEK